MVIALSNAASAWTSGVDGENHASHAYDVAHYQNSGHVDRINNPIAPIAVPQHIQTAVIL